MNESENLVPKRRFKEFTNTGTWGQRKSKEICTISTGKGNTQDKIDDGKYPFYVRSATIERSNDYLYDQEAVLTVGDGVGTGKVFHYVNGKYNLHQRVYRMFDFNNEVSAKYFYYYFSKKFYRRVMAMTAKTSVDSVRLEMIADMIIEFPSPKEQQKIVKLFESLDDAIALHQRKLDKTKSLKSAYLLEMFPAEGERKPKRRFAGFTDDWEQRKLIDVAEMFDNLRIPVTASDRVEGNTAYYGANGIQDYVDGFTHDGEFVLIAEDGANDLINYPVNYVKGKIWVNNHAHVVSGKKSELDNLFLTARIKSMNISHWLVGGGRAKLNGDVLKKIPLTLPIYEEQKKIGAFFKQLDDAIALHQRKLEKTKALKSAYLSELFPVEGERKPKRRFAGFIDDWKQGTVGEYGYFYYGKSAPKWSVTKDAIIPCVRYGELYTKFGAKIDKVYSYTNISKENLKFSTGNEVLVPRVGEDPLDFANCSWLSIPNVAIGEMISVYNTEENPLFISYYFNSQLRHAFAKRVEGGNVSNLYFTYLENITISIPNKEEQDTIANFLESLDSVVEHHQHKLEKLKNIKQAYLNELFV